MALFASALTVLLFLFQRAEAKRRFVVLLLILIPAELFRRYVWLRDYHAEAWTAFGIALAINVLFWLFIGRYNPVGSSDRIQVLGMDD